jgi:hypothetical protein
VSGDVGALLEAAAAARRAGDWPAAKASFEAALALDESPEVLYGLADTLWWLGDTQGAVRYSEGAYAAFRRRPDPVQTALAGIGLYFIYRISLGNRAASRGWLARVARLVEEFELAPVEGWVLLMRAHDCDDPGAGERWARQAREAARGSGDADLELCALSEAGACLVRAGRIDEGIALTATRGPFCTEAETPLDWNQRGPPAPPEPPGSGVTGPPDAAASVTPAGPPSGSERLANGCPDRALPLVSERLRTAFSDTEQIESAVRIQADGNATVATRLSSRLRRPLEAQVTVAFLDEAGGRLASVSRSYRLPGRSASRAPKARIRSGAVELQLDPALRCRLARTHISHSRLGGPRI